MGRRFVKISVWVGAVLVAAGLAGLSGAAQANLIVNGGFETGNIGPWSLTGNRGFFTVANSAADSHSGNWHVRMAPDGSDGFLSQTIATTVGNTYELSFWLFHERSPIPGDIDDFSATLAGVTGYSVLNSPSFPWTEYVFDVAAASTSTTLSFAFRSDRGSYKLDDVAIEDRGAVIGAVPEPGSLALMGLGVAALCLGRRRAIA